MKLSDFNFEKEVLEMVDEFGGYNDSNAICNLKLGGRNVQVSISLIDQDDSDFNEWDGVPEIKLKMK